MAHEQHTPAHEAPEPRKRRSEFACSPFVLLLVLVFLAVAQIILLAVASATLNRVKALEDRMTG